MTSRIYNSRDALTFLLLTSLTVLVPPAGAFAQSLPTLEAESGAAYARIRHLEGEVTVTGSQGERTGDSLGINSPVLPSDQVATGAGRVEVQLADGSLVRLDRDTLFEAKALSDVANQLEHRNWLLLHSGGAYVHVQGLDSADEVFRVDTPVASIYFLTQGVFRIDVSASDGRTTVSSHSGVAEVVSEAISVLARSGERTDIIPYGRPSEPRPFNAFSQDDFDRWNRARQAAYVKPYENLPAREVPAEVQSYVTELAYYGEWVYDDVYGWVWRPPSAGVDWSPYLVGRWDYAPSGWLWVSYEPWGWAPYHYGRWEFSVAVGWFWIPGSVYSGAWVSWAWGSGYLGWCALNYYNQPVVYVNYRHTHHHRAWVFVPQDRIHHARIQRAALPRYRLEPGAVKALSRPPTRNPVTVARGSASGRPPAGTTVVSSRDDGQRVSFRTLEGRGRYKREAPAGTTARAPGSVPRTRSVGYRRGPAPPGSVRATPDPSVGTPPAAAAPPSSTATPRVTRGRVGAEPDPGARAPSARGAVSNAPPRGTASRPSLKPSTDRGRRVIQLDDRRAILQRMFRKPGTPSAPSPRTKASSSRSRSGAQVKAQASRTTRPNVPAARRNPSKSQVKAQGPGRSAKRATGSASQARPKSSSGKKSKGGGGAERRN